MSGPLTDTLKRAAAALEAERIPFLLGGGLGGWARGGPPSSKDIDLMLKRNTVWEKDFLWRHQVNQWYRQNPNRR